jgi:hypothetical protein
MSNEETHHEGIISEVGVELKIMNERQVRSPDEQTDGTKGGLRLHFFALIL